MNYLIVFATWFAGIVFGAVWRQRATSEAAPWRKARLVSCPMLPVGADGMPRRLNIWKREDRSYYVSVWRIYPNGIGRVLAWVCGSTALAVSFDLDFAAAQELREAFSQMINAPDGIPVE